MNRPERIYNVSMTQLSIARHYRGITFNGAYYHYFAQTDTLIRGDIYKASLADNKAEAERIAKIERAKWENNQKSFAGF